MKPLPTIAATSILCLTVCSSIYPPAESTSCDIPARTSIDHADTSSIIGLYTMCSVNSWAPNSVLWVLPGDLIVETVGLYIGPTFVVYWKTPSLSAELVINDALVYTGPHQGMCIGFIGCIIYECGGLHFSDLQGYCAVVLLMDY